MKNNNGVINENEKNNGWKENKVMKKITYEENIDNILLRNMKCENIIVNNIIWK